MGSKEKVGFAGGGGEHGKGGKDFQAPPCDFRLRGGRGGGGVFLGILTVQRGLPECGAVPKIRGVKPCPLTWQHPTSAPTLHSAPYLERAVIVPHCTDEAAEAPGGEGTEQRRGRCGWYQAGRGSGKQS